MEPKEYRRHLCAVLLTTYLHVLYQTKLLKSLSRASPECMMQKEPFLFHYTDGKSRFPTDEKCQPTKIVWSSRLQNGTGDTIKL